jgi:hypothetical protein
MESSERAFEHFAKLIPPHVDSTSNFELFLSKAGCMLILLNHIHSTKLGFMLTCISIASDSFQVELVNKYLDDLKIFLHKCLPT